MSEFQNLSSEINMKKRYYIRIRNLKTFLIVVSVNVCKICVNFEKCCILQEISKICPIRISINY